MQSQGCTFKPQINKADAIFKVMERAQRVRGDSISSGEDGSRTGARSRLSDPSVAGYMLPKQTVPVTHVTSQDREFEEHCTFAPDTSRTKNARPVLPTHTPRGFKEAVNRVRTAKKEREQLQAELERASSGVGTPRSKGEVKPFTFLLDSRRSRAPPLLYMDVNLGPGRTGRIGIHAGDDPRVLARNFAAAYHLDEHLTARLEDLVRQHMEALGPGASA